MLAEIASRVTTSVRALEGALIRVVAYASMNEVTPTPELARHVLRRLGADEATDVRSVNEILEATAQEFGLEPEDLRGKSRQQPVAAARQVAMYLASELTEHSPGEIGEAIGGRDRKTVTHGINRVRQGATKATRLCATRSITCDADSRTRRHDRLEWKNHQLVPRCAFRTSSDPRRRFPHIPHPQQPLLR